MMHPTSSGEDDYSGSRMDLLEILRNLGEWTLPAETPQDALTYALDQAMEYFGCDAGSVILFDPNDNDLSVEVSRGLPDEERDIRLPLGGGIAGWVALNQRPALVEDVRVDPRYVERHPGVLSVMAVPMPGESMAAGVVMLEKVVVAGFSEADLADMKAIVRVLSVTIGRLWRLESLEKRYARQGAVIRIGRRLSNRFELDGILSDLTREGMTMLGCRMGSLYLVHRKSDLLRLQVLVDEKGPIEYSEELGIGDSSLGAPVLHQKMVEVSNLAKTEEHHLVNFIRSYDLVGMLCCPIVYENEVIGVLNAYTDHAHRFSDDEKLAFRALADFGAAAIENARLYSRIIEAEDSLRSGERLTVLGMLAAEIAHEIRNPLTVIKLLVESMELEDSLDPRMRDDLQVVGEKINHLGEIVGRVLNFGKNQSFIFSKWDLLQIIRDSLQLVRYKMMKNRIRVVFDTDLRSAPIHCNRGQIQQVLLNLILNADQAMPDGGSLVLRVLVESVNGVRCVGVTLSDTGVGIPEEIRGSIFDSFLTDKPEGTGLGLAIVKRILKDHRGDIELAETSGEGTVFHFWIPMQD